MIYVSFLKRGLYSMGHEGSCQVYCMTEIIFVSFLAAGLSLTAVPKKEVIFVWLCQYFFQQSTTVRMIVIPIICCGSRTASPPHLLGNTVLQSRDYLRFSLYLLISTLLLELQFLMQFKAEVLFKSNRGSFRKLTEIKLCSQSKQSTPKHKTSSREEQNKLFLQAK